MNTITATINAQGAVTLSDNKLGHSGEHNTVTFNIVLPSFNSGMISYYRIFCDGYFSERLLPDSVSGIIEYTLPQAIMKSPRMRFQLVGYRAEDDLVTLVWKSDIFSFFVDSSLNHNKSMPTEAFEPIEEALILCNNATEKANKTINRALEVLDETNADLDKALRYMENAENYSLLAQYNANLVSQAKKDIATMETNITEMYQNKITDYTEVENGTNEQIVSAAAIREYVNDKNSQLAEKSAGNMVLENKKLKLLSVAFGGNIPEVICEIDLESFATKSYVDATAAPKTRTVAGISLENDITAEQLNERLGVISTAADLNFSPLSERAQSGKAVAQAISSVTERTAALENGTVPNLRTVAGISLENDITAEQLNERLGVEAMSADTVYNPNSLNSQSGKAVAEAISGIDFLNKVYPVGSIYLSANTVSPSTLFGGDWEQIKDTFLLASGDSYALGNTGGEAEHTLLEEEIPSHNHTAQTKVKLVSTAVESGTKFSRIASTGTLTDGVASTSVGSSGGGQAHNNMPPYLAVNVWKRVA